MQTPSTDLSLQEIENKIKKKLNPNYEDIGHSTSSKKIQTTTKNEVGTTQAQNWPVEIEKKSVMSNDSIPLVSIEEVKPEITEQKLLRLLKIPNNFTFINKAYRLILNRKADPAGLTFQLESLQSGESRETILCRILNSSEFKNQNNDFVIPDFLIPKDFPPAPKKQNFREKILSRKKKIPIVSNLILCTNFILEIPNYFSKLNQIIKSRFDIANLQFENVQEKLETKFDKVQKKLEVQFEKKLKSQITNSKQHTEQLFNQVLTKISEINDRTKDFNSDYNQHSAIAIRKLNAILVRSEQSTERTINAILFHYENCFSQIEKLNSQVQQLKIQLEMLSSQKSNNNKDNQGVL